MAQREDLEDLAAKRHAPNLLWLGAAYSQYDPGFSGNQLECLYPMFLALLFAQHLHRLVSVFADEVLADPLPEDLRVQPPLDRGEVVAAQGVEPVGEGGLDVLLRGDHAS